MKEDEIIIECPRCGDQCNVVYGNGFDHDFIFCSCGFEHELETNTNFDEE